MGDVMAGDMVSCPVCKGAVGLRMGGRMFAHERYADGAGPDPDQPHTMVTCEGVVAPKHHYDRGADHGAA